MGVHHTTVICWIRQKGKKLPDSITPESLPNIGELDELETFVRSKNKVWLWIAVD